MLGRGSPLPHESLSHGVEQLWRVTRLGETRDGPGWQGVGHHRHSPPTREKNDRDRPLRLRQGALERWPTQPRQVNIQDKARRGRAAGAAQEGLRRREGLYGVLDRPEETSDGAANQRVVVNDDNGPWDM